MHLSYTELDDLSSRIASYLTEHHDIKEGDYIGICLSRNALLPVTLLSILRANACYLPLDAGFPPERLEYMVADSQCKLIIGDDDTLEKLNLTQPNQLTIKQIIDSASNCESIVSEVGMNGTNIPAYLIYTSGSTGQPKGVKLPRASLANLIAWQHTKDAFNKPCRTLQYTPISFDVHFQEIFSTWRAGGTLVIIDDETRKDPLSLNRYLSEKKITHLFLPFVALQQMCEIAVTSGPIPEALKHIVTAGEQLQINRFITMFFEKLPSTRLHNHYGPSETHVVTAHTLSDSPANWPTLPPIGAPIDGVETLIVSNGKTVSGDNEGELWLAGICLANGYQGRGDLTRERFVFSDLSGAPKRYYKTGDLVRQLSSGELEYLGRMDDQIKVRGYRVEIGEIEATLSSSRKLKKCAVKAIKSANGENRLIAYIVPANEQIEPSTDIRNSAAETRQIKDWQSIWDNTYYGDIGSIDPRYDFVGWNSSYTGKALAEKDMRCWVDETVKRILCFGPKKVLEIGCGSGLILHHIAPHCEQYIGTDFSESALKRLSTTIQLSNEKLEHVSLEKCAAHELKHLQENAFDLIIMNSVTQHFPNQQYLNTVIQDCLDLLNDNGTIFIGDVTNSLTREAFFASVARSKSKLTIDNQNLYTQVQQKLAQENELVIAPQYFHTLISHLQKKFDGKSAVRTKLKEGNYRNELGDLRYDVEISVQRSNGSQPGNTDSNSDPMLKAIRLENPESWLDIETALEKIESTGLLITGLKNTRLMPYQKAISELNGSAIKPDNATAPSIEMISPDLLAERVRQRGLEIQLLWQTETWQYNAYCYDPNTITPKIIGLCEQSLEKENHLDLDQYTSTPVSSDYAQLEQSLRVTMNEKLPEYMQPSKYIVLSQLPLTPTGKLDRRALPAPNRTRPATGVEYLEPISDVQKLIATIWSEVLEIDEIGLNDNFFDIGGTSISSLRVIMKINEKMGAELSIALFFQYSTLGGLANFIEKGESQTQRDLKSDINARAKKAKAAFAKGKRRGKTL